MQLCAAGRESNGLESERVTHLSGRYTADYQSTEPRTSGRFTLEAEIKGKFAKK
jgi:hypothetical protein